MDITGLWTLQCMMFLMVAAGAILKKIGILKAEGKGMLTDLVLYFFLPCNIIHSFQMQFEDFNDALADSAKICGCSGDLSGCAGSLLWNEQGVLSKPSGWSAPGHALLHPGFKLWILGTPDCGGSLRS